MIACDPEDLEAVKSILRQHVPHAEVRAFGSRVHKRNLKKYSDLDLAILAPEALDPHAAAELADAFSESNLPFKVDLVEWVSISNEFRSVIEQSHEIIQKK
jgi:predicted nucleotidyltransferase